MVRPKRLPYPPRRPPRMPGVSWSAVLSARQGRTSQAIGRALNRPSAPVQDVRVDHRRADVAVAEELLDGADVVAGPDELGGERMPKHVRRGGLGDSRPPGGLRDRLLDHGLMQMVAVPDAGPPVRVVRRSRKDVLPSPLAVGVAVLASERVGKRRPPKAAAKILTMPAAHSFEMIEQLPPAGGRQHRHAILASLAITDHDLQALEVDFLDAHAKCLEEAEARAVQQSTNEEHDAVELLQEAPHLFVGQDVRKAPWAIGADHLTELADVPAEHRLVEEEEGVAGLVLRRRA